jgi:AAA ATPase domain
MAVTVPFRVGEQVTGEFFTDREDEVKRILQAMRSPTRLLVYGERRQGKSSAIQQARARAEHDGIRVVWVDVSTVAHFGEVAQRLVASIPFGWIWREELQLRLVRAHLRVEARMDAAGHPMLALVPGVDAGDAEEGKDHLRKITLALDGLAGEKDERVVLVLDEFQEIDRIVPRGGWFLRDLMQTTHRLSFVCAGSKLGLIDELISATGPLHRFFEPLTVGPIDPGHLAKWIESRMEGAGVTPGAGLGAAIVDLVGPRTQDCLQLARAVFLAGGRRGRIGVEELPGVFRRAVLEDRDRFETSWASLADSHRGILRALATGETRLGAQDVRRRHALPSTSAVSKAVKVLQDRRHVGAREPLRIEDPYFREWILLRAMPDGLPHGASAAASED